MSRVKTTLSNRPTVRLSQLSLIKSIFRAQDQVLRKFQSLSLYLRVLRVTYGASCIMLHGYCICHRVAYSDGFREAWKLLRNPSRTVVCREVLAIARPIPVTAMAEDCEFDSPSSHESTKDTILSYER